CIVSALAIGLWQGPVGAYSAFWGGIICVTANSFLFYQAFKTGGAQAAQKIMRGFVWGQMGKFLITVVLFALAFLVGQVEPLALFLGYLFTQAAFWLAPLFLKRVSSV
ncbi:MAG TPA: ATP synthase subunit I, partial [Gammaproteobacteria bacterium]|nr:ATP synthase subunit I [Gammaproteobacteria bacterium]